MLPLRNKFIVSCLLLLTSLCSGAFADTYSPQDECCGQFRGHIDWLYWRPCPEGIYVAAKARINVSASVGNFLDTLSQDLSTKRFDFTFDSGIRLGLGYQSAGCCGLDFALKWTHFSPHNSKTIHADCPSQLTGQLLAPFGAYYTSGFESVANALLLIEDRILLPPPELVSSDFGLNVCRIKGKWDLSLNLVDMEMGRPFCVGNCLRLRPHFDLRFARIAQHLTIKSEGDIQDFESLLFPAEEAEVVSSFRISEHFENTFTGLGPRAGVDLEWDLGCGFGCYGNIAAAIVYGEREASNRQKGARFNVTDAFTSLPIDGDQFATRSNRDIYCGRAITDLGLGVYWLTTVCDGAADLTIKLGWEHHAFFNQGVADAAAGYILLAKEADSTLTTKGLTLSAKVSF